MLELLGPQLEDWKDHICADGSVLKAGGTGRADVRGRTKNWG